MNRRILPLYVTAVIAVLAAFLLPPIAQDPRYHNFADQREWWRVPHFWNVLSNLPISLAGLYGLWVWPRARWNHPLDRWPWLLVAVSSVLIGIGSAYYHWAPDNRTLFWDRLPMTLCFMSILSALIVERIHSKAGVLLLGPFLVLGVLSVEVWRRGELTGVGDLRFYALVQFYPMLALPLILLLFRRSRYTHGHLIWHLGLYYVLAKIAEALDRQIFSWSGYLLSGHSLKHFLAAMALFQAMKMLGVRGTKEEGGADQFAGDGSLATSPEISTRTAPAKDLPSL